MKKPNIVFIQNDHQAFYHWNLDRENRPKRPNFEKLAAEGAEFTDAYCSSPLCGPTRRTMLTGVFAHKHGQYHNYTEAEYLHEVYLDTLAEHGYQNYYFGKWHAGPGDAKEHGCEGFCYTDYGNPYISKEYKEYLKKKDLPQAVHRIVKSFYVDGISDRGDWDGMEPGADYQCKSWWCGEHAVGVTTTPKETHESFFLANLACEKLEEIARSNNERPFSLRVDFWGPHQPHFPTQEFLDMYEDFHLPQYGNFNDDLKGKPKTYFRERNVPLGQNDILIQPSVLKWEDWEMLIKYCFAHQTMIDAAGGMIIDKLHELGLDKNTLIVWTSDHGDGLACHGGHFDKGSYMCEEVLRIPLAMKWNGIISPGQVRSELVSTIDFPVTLLDAAGLKYTENEVDGESILPLVTEKSSQWREDLMSETQGHGYGDDTMARAVRYQDWKYIITKDDIEELYNLKEDPFELKNLAENEEYQAVLKDMQERLQKWQKTTNDTFQMR